jgi:amidase
VSDLLAADATEQLLALASRQVSAVELLEMAVARKDQVHARLNAVVRVDLERAMDRAKVIDERRALGEEIGPLAGLPMTIKDTLDVAGMPATSGLEAFRLRRAEDATVVAHAKRAGAVVWGKTNVPVMAADWQSYNDLYGTTNNPWDPERTPGGSSGGAAAALAVGVTALEIGSDIGGSLRVPASFCGVYSHKPTWGMVSQRGHVPPRPGSLAERDLNVVGPMARSARDLRLLLSVLEAGPLAAKAAPADLGALRIGLWIDEPAFPLDAEVKTVIEALAVDLAAAGATIEPIRSPVPIDQLMASYQTLLGSLVGTDLPPNQQRQMGRMRPIAKAALALGADPQSSMGLVRAYTASHAEWLAADETRARLGQQMAELFHRYDAILAPVAPVTAFQHNHRPFAGRKLTCSNGDALPYVAMLNWIALATALHLPVTTVPAGEAMSSLPVGVQIIGPHGADGKTLAIAQAIDEKLRGFVAPPLVF